MQTYMANPDKIERKWYVVDATDKTLGRLTSEIAKVLRGKINQFIHRTSTQEIRNRCKCREDRSYR